MPFDSQPKLAPFSLERFRAWLLTQPPETAYKYIDYSTCAVGAYVKASGGRIHNERKYYIYELEGEEICAGLSQSIRLANALLGQPRTYGALVERLSEVIAARKP